MASGPGSGSRRIAVRVTPRAARSEVVGCSDGVLQVRLAAPPVDGRANQALIELLAGALGVANGRVHVVKGAASRTKLVEVEGLNAEDLLLALERQR